MSNALRPHAPTALLARLEQENAMKVRIKATVMPPIYLQHSASLKCATEIQGYY